MVSMDDSFQMSFDDKIISEMHPLITTFGKNHVLTMKLWTFLYVAKLGRMLKIKKYIHTHTVFVKI